MVAVVVAGCARTEPAVGLDASARDASGPDVPLADAGQEEDDAGLGLDAAPDGDAAPRFDGALVEDAAAPDSGSEEPTYKDDLHPMFVVQGCTTFACHGSLIAVGGVLAYLPDAPTGYADLINRVSARRPEVLVRPGAPDESVLVEHAETTLLSNAIVTVEEAALIRHWVEIGAPYERNGGPDAGVSDGGGADAGPGSCTMEGTTGLPPLPLPCLPRCSTTTWARVVDCRAEADPVACQTAAISTDQIEPVLVGGAQDLISVDCQRCLDWQTSSCLVEVCTPEFLELQRCQGFRSPDPCQRESTLLNDCARAHPEFTACQRQRDQTCVAR